MHHAVPDFMGLCNDTEKESLADRSFMINYHVATVYPITHLMNVHTSSVNI